MIVLDNIPNFADIGVIQRFHYLVLSFYLLLTDRNKDFDGNFLIGPFISTLKNMGISTTTQFLMNHIVVHIACILQLIYPHLISSQASQLLFDYGQTLIVENGLWFQIIDESILNQLIFEMCMFNIFGFILIDEQKRDELFT